VTNPSHLHSLRRSSLSRRSSVDSSARSDRIRAEGCAC
jgi:hypothetical protein